MKSAQSTFLPPNFIPAFNKEVGDFFLNKAKLEQGDESLVTFCIEKALTFITDAENMKLLASWIKTGKVTIGDEELNVTLTPDNKY